MTSESPPVATTNAGPTSIFSFAKMLSASPGKAIHHARLHRLYGVGSQYMIRLCKVESSQLGRPAGQRFAGAADAWGNGTAQKYTILTNDAKGGGCTEIHRNARTVSSIQFVPCHGIGNAIRPQGRQRIILQLDAPDSADRKRTSDGTGKRCASFDLGCSAAAAVPLQ